MPRRRGVASLRGMLRCLLVGLAFVLASCSSDGMPAGGDDGGGLGDPCSQVSTFTCASPDYCDEVYSSESATELADLCDGADDEILSGQCRLMQCCYSTSGLFGRPSLHCVTDEISSDYRSVCEGRGDTYCVR